MGNVMGRLQGDVWLLRKTTNLGGLLVEMEDHTLWGAGCLGPPPFGQVLHCTHFACQHNVCYSDSDEVAWYGRAFMRSLKAVSAQTSVLIYNIMFLLGMTI